MTLCSRTHLFAEPGRGPVTRAEKPSAQAESVCVPQMEHEPPTRGGAFYTSPYGLATRDETNGDQGCGGGRATTVPAGLAGICL